MHRGEAARKTRRGTHGCVGSIGDTAITAGENLSTLRLTIRPRILQHSNWQTENRQTTDAEELKLSQTKPPDLTTAAQLSMTSLKNRTACAPGSRMNISTILSTGLADRASAPSPHASVSLSISPAAVSPNQYATRANDHKTGGDCRGFQENGGTVRRPWLVENGPVTTYSVLFIHLYCFKDAGSAVTGRRAAGLLLVAGSSGPDESLDLLVRIH